MISKFVKYSRTLILFALIFIFAGIFPVDSDAATYSYTSNLRSNYVYGGRLGWPVATVFGYNRTHGITRMLKSWITTTGPSYDYIIVNYEVPDDGSTWYVTGSIVSYITATDYVANTDIRLWDDLGRDQFEAVHTTGGSFTGPSSKTATDAASLASSSASVAASNAASAMSAASAASSSAASAHAAVSNASGNTITAVRDAGGTVLSEARQAKVNAQTASANAQNAYNEAVIINSRVASLQTTIDDINTTMTNISNNVSADTTPPQINLSTVSGAVATSGDTIGVVVDVADNASSVFTYSTNGATYYPLPADRKITCGVSVPGLNLLPVWVQDEAGNVASKYIRIRKI